MSSEADNRIEAARKRNQEAANASALEALSEAGKADAAAGKSLWDLVVSAGKAVVDQAADIGGAIVDGGTAAGKALAKGAADAGKAVAKGTVAAGKSIAEGGRAAEKALSDGIDAANKAVEERDWRGVSDALLDGAGNVAKAAATGTASAGKEMLGGAAKAGKSIATGVGTAGKAVAKETKTLAKKTAENAKTALGTAKRLSKDAGGKLFDAAAKNFEAGKKVASAVVACPIFEAKLKIAKMTVAAAQAVPQKLTANPTVEKFLLDKMAKDVSPDLKERDGKQFLAEDCPNCDPQLSGRGALPCQQFKGPKIYFANGINTPPETLCKTMQALAKQTCKEVVGVFNASAGVPGDLAECVDLIKGQANIPSVSETAQIIVDALKKEPPEEVELYVHSEGGLATQQAIKQARGSLVEAFPNETPYQLKSRLSNLKVHAFGTAESGWPKGPVYEVTNNDVDPVPHAIASVQKSYQDKMTEVCGPSGGCTAVKVNRIFNTPLTSLESGAPKTKVAPLTAHGMIETYIPSMPQNPCAACRKLGA